ncbi:hypothetical protein GOODEAATRI_014483 [Goodea atripinnis]|uniref:Uncharacterized protein n=1 Tax=Goodea atripinnis TaxID=208336 RepID=A0ABV0PE30_9TELE
MCNAKLESSSHAKSNAMSSYYKRRTVEELTQNLNPSAKEFIPGNDIETQTTQYNGNQIQQRNKLKIASMKNGSADVRPKKTLASGQQHLLNNINPMKLICN